MAKPHLPTLAVVLIFVVVLIGLYHLVSKKK